jgi:hypothetical protein
MEVGVRANLILPQWQRLLRALFFETYLGRPYRAADFACPVACYVRR